jgi:hypothetical protein
VFLLNSRLTPFTAAPIARGTPFPEVTELYCLVPERFITRAPEYILLVHMCLFVVRIPNSPTRIFPADDPAGFPIRISLHLDLKPLRLQAYGLRPPIGLYRISVGLEC